MLVSPQSKDKMLRGPRATPSTLGAPARVVRRYWCPPAPGPLRRSPRVAGKVPVAEVEQSARAPPHSASRPRAWPTGKGCPARPRQPATSARRNVASWPRTRGVGERVPEPPHMS